MIRVFRCCLYFNLRSIHVGLLCINKIISIIMYFRLSVDAKKEYDCLAGEENEVFNALIEKKMDYAKGELNEEDSLSTTLESKYTRSVVKYVSNIQ